MRYAWHRTRARVRVHILAGDAEPVLYSDLNKYGKPALCGTLMSPVAMELTKPPGWQHPSIATCKKCEKASKTA